MYIDLFFMFIITVLILYSYATTQNQFAETASIIRQIWSGGCGFSCRQSANGSGFSGLSCSPRGQTPEREGTCRNNQPGPSSCMCDACPCNHIEDFLSTCRPPPNMYTLPLECTIDCVQYFIHMLLYSYHYLMGAIEYRTCRRLGAQLFETRSQPHLECCSKHGPHNEIKPKFIQLNKELKIEEDNLKTSSQVKKELRIDDEKSSKSQETKENVIEIQKQTSKEISLDIHKNEQTNGSKLKQTAKIASRATSEHSTKAEEKSKSKDSVQRVNDNPPTGTSTSVQDKPELSKANLPNKGKKAEAPTRPKSNEALELPPSIEARIRSKEESKDSGLKINDHQPLYKVISEKPKENEDTIINESSEESAVLKGYCSKCVEKKRTCLKECPRAKAKSTK